jgi:hypothetical protein
MTPTELLPLVYDKLRKLAAEFPAVPEVQN